MDNERVTIMEEHMEESIKKKAKREEVDMKIPLISSFILMIVIMSFGLSGDKFVYWGIEEGIVGSGEIGLMGILSYHLSLLVMLFVFIRFGHSKLIHWLSLCIVFSVLGFFVFNNGSCITEKGIYERDFGKTVFYPFEEVKTYKVDKRENVMNEKPYEFTFYLKNGDVFTFQQKAVDTKLLLKISHSIAMAEAKTK
jgi:hypothetical protein